MRLKLFDRKKKKFAGSCPEHIHRQYHSVCTLNNQSTEECLVGKIKSSDASAIKAFAEHVPNHVQNTMKLQRM